MKLYKKTVLLSLLCSVVASKSASETLNQKVTTAEKPFTVELGATRIIYNLSSSSTDISVTNHQEYPILVQSTTFEADMVKKAAFSATPPLFRLEGGQKTRIRIIRTGGDFPNDRESLRWLCVKGIPPQSSDAWADESKNKASDIMLDVQISINNCIKLIVRPESLINKAKKTREALEWSVQNGKLTAKNTSPFVVNISSLSFAGKPLEETTYVLPFSSHTFVNASARSGKVSWTVVDDYGGVSAPFEKYAR
ncbi:P pilus assembly chaperone PapD [Enterobacter sp. AG326]|nr:P pilus assembly chaperone PapD [Enterobacter sp. AG326]